MARAALFILVGLLFFAHWLVTDPTYEGSDSQDEWNYVPGGRSAFRASLVAAAGAAFASFANILEDGVGMGWAFFAFVSGAAILLLGLLVLTVVIALGGRGGRRLLALLP